jgi:geranylgeranylglycerol-phosphate geranylgeranyltransferase
MKIFPYIKITRPFNSLMMGLAVIIGIQVADPYWINLEYDFIFGKSHYLLLMIISFLVAFFITSSSMVLNDYADYSIDKINFPNKPLPSGLIKRNVALYYGIMLALTGLIFAFLIKNSLSILLAFTGLIIAILYNFYFKKKGFIGNLMVAYTTALPFIYGASLVYFKNFEFIAILSSMAFLSNVSREIIKGIVDIEGDSKMNVKTLANTKGPLLASKISSVFIIIAIILSILPFLISFSFYYILFIIIADIIFLYYTIKLLKNPSKYNSYQVKKMYLVAMFIALIGFLFL